MRRIDIDSLEMRRLLNRVEKPGRYVGGEYGAVSRIAEDDDYAICVVFPDLYEIGMSNQALRILYKILNDTKGLHAERAFSPELDFDVGLREFGLKLYSLENHYEVRDFDLLAITIGYELSFTNYLNFLDASGIPVERAERNEEHPLVILGGPAMTNPVPWADFVDAVFIGESEGILASSMLTLKHRKEAGFNKRRLKSELNGMDGFWTPDSHVTTLRQIWMGFGKENDEPAAFPVPSIKPIQDHGVVEIMRGCPNKCRFCHAGVFYRPYRQKSPGRIVQEVKFLVDKCGYRTITLSSLSTGDYIGLEALVGYLNKMFRHRRISFSLPSLRVNSVTLPLIASLGAVRKSGLTFAVETPALSGQRRINKEVSADKVISILNEAKREGWRLAKFYFMLGLPGSGDKEEAIAITDYLLHVQKSTGMNINVNIGTFIPKPHTPYERASQLTDEQSMSQLMLIRDGVKPNKKINISFHSPFSSFLEGIITRGDKRAGKLCYTAWKNGTLFDAWDDKINKNAWKEAIKTADWDVERETCQARPIAAEMPWDGIRLRVTHAHLLKENIRSRDTMPTSSCMMQCPDHCGVCGADSHVVNPEDDLADPPAELIDESAPVRRLLLIYSKDGPARYFGHLDLMNTFEKAIQRAGIHLEFSQGYNPKPRIEFAQPLPLGIKSDGEVCSMNLMSGFDSDCQLINDSINAAMPRGIRICDSFWIKDTREGQKIQRVMSHFWGSDWKITIPDESIANAHEHFLSLDRNLIRECKKRGILDDIEIRFEEQSWIIRLRAGGSRHHNIKRLLESVLGESPLRMGWEISRIRCLAKGSDEGMKPVSYFSVFSASQ